MKKMIFGLVAVLVLFGAVVTYTHWDNAAAPAAVAASPTPAPVETPTVHSLDYDAIRALYPADTPAITFKDEVMNWDLYLAYSEIPTM